MSGTSWKTSHHQRSTASNMRVYELSAWAKCKTGIARNLGTWSGSNRRPIPCKNTKSPTCAVFVLDHSRSLETIAMHIFVGDAPDRAARRGKKEFFDWHLADIDPKKVGEIVEARHEFRV